MRKSLFNYSFYSHPEIGKFQGVTCNPSTSGLVGDDLILSMLPVGGGVTGSAGRGATG
jgi:hypothetical protein